MKQNSNFYHVDINVRPCSHGGMWGTGDDRGRSLDLRISSMLRGCGTVSFTVSGGLGPTHPNAAPTACGSPQLQPSPKTSSTLASFVHGHELRIVPRFEQFLQRHFHVRLRNFGYSVQYTMKTPTARSPLEPRTSCLMTGILFGSSFRIACPARANRKSVVLAEGYGLAVSFAFFDCCVQSSATNAVTTVHVAKKIMTPCAG